MSMLKWPTAPYWDPDSDLEAANPSCLTLRRTDVAEGDAVYTVVNRKLLNLWKVKTYRATLRCDGRPDCDVVCKMVVGKRRVFRLRNAAKLYRDELRQFQGETIPVCYGLFEVDPDDDDITACLVVSYCGETLQRPLFGQSWDFKFQVLTMLIGIHEAGVSHGDFDETHIVVDKDGRPWIVDFDSAKTHECCQKMLIEFHTKEPESEAFGCLEIWDTCRRAGVWTPRRIRYLDSLHPIECATSPEELALRASEGVPEDRALDEAIRSIRRHQRYLKARAECDCEGAWASRF